ncbi:hypothetical protein LLG95_00870 [bacterium]|nr:hypothetical protein [bacterium]
MNRPAAAGSDPLLEKASDLCARAHRVMDQLGLVERWGKVGKVCLVGSVRFGLMATPNIDFEIYVDRPTIRAGFETIQSFAEVEGVRQIQFCNFMNTPTDPGLYWRIDYEDNEGVLWDIDNWLVPFAHPHAGLADGLATAMQRALTDETRRAILTIKNAASANGTKFRGIDIYKAVLAGGVRAYDDFTTYIREHPPTPEIETWHP